MNMTYGKTSDGNTIVIDENGKANEINEDISENELLLQNKIEILEKNINKVAKNYSNNFVSLIALATTPLFMGIIFATPAIIAKLFGFVGPIINYLFACSVATCLIGGGLILAIIPGLILVRKEKIKEIEKFCQLKDEFEEELKKEKEKRSKVNLTVFDNVLTKCDKQDYSFISLADRSKEMESEIESIIYVETGVDPGLIDDDGYYLATDNIVSDDKKKVKKRKTRY